MLRDLAYIFCAVLLSRKKCGDFRAKRQKLLHQYAYMDDEKECIRSSLYSVFSDTKAMQYVLDQCG